MKNSSTRFFLLVLSFFVAGSLDADTNHAQEKLSETTASRSKPNILFFFVDDMGWQDTSVPFHTETTQLNKDYRTPNMERLARSGVLFTNAYACSICSPSRISLMTGLNAARHGVTCWTLRKDRSPEQQHAQLSPALWPLNGLQPVGAGVERSTESVTLPELLRKQGYRTIHAGKAHFGAAGTPGADPVNLGFDVNIAGSCIGGPGSYHGDKNFSAIWRGGDPIWNVPGLEKYHGQKINLTEAITREAISEVKKSVAEDKPFYLYMSHYAVHAPFEPDRRFVANYENSKWGQHKKTYASMIESMDKSLGDLLDTLDQLKIADETIVVFMSDNGSPRPNPRNLPLRGHKISGYEGGTRVPLIVNWPGVSPKGERTASPVIIEDVFPTFLEWAGAELPETDGVSFTDVIKNPNLDHSDRPLFWHYPNLYDMPPYSAIRQGELKLIYWHADRKIELFNLSQDIGEENDLSAQQPDDVSRLAKRLSEHLREKTALMPVDKTTGEPVPLPDQVSNTGGKSKTPLPTFIVAGQSNAFRLGRISGGNGKPAEATCYHFANPDCVKPANLNARLQTFAGDQRLGGFGAGIAQALGQEFPDGFAIISYAVCGSNLHTQWRPDNDDGFYRKYFDTFVEKGLGEIKQSSGREPKVMGMLWHQGESNSGSPEEVAAYDRLMPSVIGNFQKTYGEVPFVLGEIREFDDKPTCAAINQKMREIAKKLITVEVAELQDVGWESPTNVHVSLQGAHEAGRRLVSVWKSTQEMAASH